VIEQARIFGSEQFAALLTMGQIEVASRTGQERRRPYACEYVGTLKLAKNFGWQPAYHIRRRDPCEGC
jgi:hypothetical protein